MTSLASLLAIPPLSKVQLQSRAALRDARFDSPGVIDLPFWFFQCVVGDHLEIRSPGGFMARVSPEDICDIVKADPIVVQAMPRHVFNERLKLSWHERQRSLGPECYRPAHLL
jgi:adenylate kinase